MRKQIQGLIMLLLFVPLWGTEIIIKSNEILIQKKDFGFTVLQTTNEHAFYSSAPGNPAIPLTHHYFSIPANSRIESITITPLEVSREILSLPLIPVQESYPLSYIGTRTFSQPNDLYSQRGNYPESYLSHFGDGYSGGAHIGYVTYYTAQYEPQSRALFQPKQFKIEINYANDRNDPIVRNTKAANAVLSTLGLDTFRTEIDTTGYLLIYPAAFANAYAPLVEWRKKQGLSVLTQTIENINLNYKDIPGLQDKIRTYIYDMYENHYISYVTLGADTDIIPDRKFFAFDCDFHYQADENDIPADMYYSNLDGNFDGNNNEILGEDSDNPDYFPEVFVGRISAHNEEEVSNYVNRLILYEQGHFSDYNISLGLSMDLWNGSNSVLCQEYILQQFFPSYYQNTMLNQEENIVANALATMAQNPNIVQHTGHANRDLMSLRHGYIDSNFLSQLQNNYGGVFYSIGCWAEAIDYNSIGEKMVMSPGKGMLAFVGNSRFGWGAPIAAGFGYSEFFQKEFFRLLFQENITHIGATSALQKIPFIPYFAGISVYKWCGYELNEEGDSYFRLFTDNPKLMTYNISGDDYGQYITVLCEEIPINNAVIRFETNNKNFRTSLDGSVMIPASDNLLDMHFSIYAEGYQTVLDAVLSNTDDIYIPHMSLWYSWNKQILQGSSYDGLVAISNMTDEIIDCSVEVIADSSITEIYYSQFNQSLTHADVQCQPHTVLDYAIFNLHMKPIQDSRQLTDGTPIQFQIRLTINGNIRKEVIRRQFTYYISAPDVILENILIEASSVVPGFSVPFSIRFSKSINWEPLEADVTFSSDVVTFAQDVQRIGFVHSYNDSLHTYAMIGNFINIPRNVAIGQLIPVQVDVAFVQNNQDYHFQSIMQIPVGQWNYYNSFNESVGMTGDHEWQRVEDPNFGNEGPIRYVLSCRPSAYGIYTVSTPDFVFQDATGISFNYSYKMPMYGQDGVFIRLVHDNQSEDLLFLGSGGALGRDGDAGYISDNWAQYALNLSELPLQPLEPGDLYHIEFTFVYADTSGLNNYSGMHDVGVFIDDLKISYEDENQINNHVHTPTIQINTYPNPIDQFDLLKIDILSWNNAKYTAEIFNIRGQRVYKNEGNLIGPVAQKLVWDKTDEKKTKVASGVYILKVKAGDREIIKKFTILK